MIAAAQKGRNAKPDDSKQKFYADYREKKFPTEFLFEQWLHKTAKYVLHFKDEGQDCLQWWIDEGGEVLHSAPFQASVWNGMIVDLWNLQVGNNVGVMDTENERTKFYDFTVKKITTVKP